METVYKCSKCKDEFNDKHECDKHELTCGKKGEKIKKLLERIAELEGRLEQLENRVLILESYQRITVPPNPVPQPIGPTYPGYPFQPTWVNTMNNQTKEQQ